MKCFECSCLKNFKRPTLSLTGSTALVGVKDRQTSVMFSECADVFMTESYFSSRTFSDCRVGDFLPFGALLHPPLGWLWRWSGGLAKKR